MERIQYKIESFLRTGDGEFESLALELFHYQFNLNRSYRAYCEAQSITPASVERWQDIPAVPIGAFKSAELATFPIGQASAVFKSSATTTGTPSRHYIKDLRYYESSLKTGFQRFVAGADPKKHYVAPLGQPPFLILTPPPSEAPHSSLSWMMDVVKRTWGGPGSDYFIQHGRLDEPRLVRSLRRAEESKQPVVLLGTTITLLAFFDYCRTHTLSWQLSASSRLMDTGGMKTQKREITRPEFVRQVGETLGIPEDQCVNEYGMCELSSQFYGHGASCYLQGPPWTRTRVTDPLTGRESPAGKPGLLRHFDLANVDSVLAIQAEDLGLVPSPNPLPKGRGQGSAFSLQGEGGRSPDEGFILLGRDPSAEVKGCSLSAEAFLA